MKFSERTLTILKSFATINKSIQLKEGNVLKTITPERTLIASATIPDEIPSESCIYDMSRFLSILSLYTEPDVEFHDKYFIISEGKRRTKYLFADVSMIHAAPEKDIKIPSKDVEVDVSWDDLQSVLKAAGVLQF
jgi:DNA polymerase processivity factor.